MRGSGDFMGTRQSVRTTTELGALRDGTEAVFLAKSISDESFEFSYVDDKIRKYAIEKYNALCEVSLN